MNNFQSLQAATDSNFNETKRSAFDNNTNTLEMTKDFGGYPQLVGKDVSVQLKKMRKIHQGQILGLDPDLYNQIQRLREENNFSMQNTARAISVQDRQPMTAKVSFIDSSTRHPDQTQPQSQMRRKLGPPMLGDLVGHETVGGELGDIVRHYTKTAEGYKVKRKARNQKTKTLDFKSLNFSSQDQLRGELFALKRYEFTGGQIEMQPVYKEDNQSVKHINNLASSMFGGIEKSDTRYQTNQDVSSQRKEDRPTTKVGSAYYSINTIQNSLSYKNPYPGFAFKFENVDDYTQKSTVPQFMAAQTKMPMVESTSDARKRMQEQLQTTLYSNDSLPGRMEEKEIFDLPNSSELPDITSQYNPITQIMWSDSQRQQMMGQNRNENAFKTISVNNDPTSTTELLKQSDAQLIQQNFRGLALSTLDHYVPDRIQPFPIPYKIKQRAMPKIFSKSHVTKPKQQLPIPRPQKYILKNVAGQDFNPQSKQLYSPKKGQYKYLYDAQPDELTDDMLFLSSVNKYFENGAIGNKTINQVQGSIRLSFDIQNMMKQHSSHIFDTMKAVKNLYIKTLLQGEEQGHCTGIKARMDPTMKYRLQQRMAKQKLIKEEQLENIRKQKELNDQRRKIKQQERLKKRLEFLENMSASQLELRTQLSKSPVNKNKLKERASQSPVRQKTLAYQKDRSEGRIISEHDSFLDSQSKHDLMSPMNVMSPRSLKGVQVKKTQTNSKKGMQRKLLCEQAKLIMEQIGLQNLQVEQFQVENQGPSVLMQKLTDYFEQANKELKGVKDARMIMQPILQSSAQLGLNENPNTRNFFISLAENGETRIKFARLKRFYLQQFLQNRYSEVVGEKILNFLESQFQSLYRIDFNGFQQVMTDLLNLGPEGYQKLVFSCFSQKNPGIICEHDIFTIMEEFKQQESLLFYKDLLMRKDVPRDYQTLVDNSDKIFFDVFLNDLKLVNSIISLQKKMMGLNQDESKPEDKQSQSQNEAKHLENDICKEIEYILRKIAQKTPVNQHAEVIDIINHQTTLADLRDKLCEFTSQHVNFEFKPTLKKHDDKRALSPVSSNEQHNNQITFKVPSKINNCLGNKNCQGHKLEQCVFISFDEFQRMIHFKNHQQVSSIVSDLLYVFSGGVFNLPLFEKELGPMRETSYPPFTKTLLYPKNMSSFLEQPKQAESKDLIEGEATDEDSKPKITVFIQKHQITEPFSFYNQVTNMEFEGVYMKRQVKKKSSIAKSPQSKEAEPALTHQFITADTAQLLFTFRKHFGVENLLSIYRAFYILSRIQPDCQNHPLGIVMDQQSCIRGFKYIFHIDCEEVAVRFYNLFVQPFGRKRMYDIDFVRFLFVIKSICSTKGDQNLKIAFAYYDYDSNGSIGSVDIINLIKHFDYQKIIKIDAIYQQIHQQKVDIQLAKQKGQMEVYLASIVKVMHDEPIDPIEKDEEDESEQEMEKEAENESKATNGEYSQNQESPKKMKKSNSIQFIKPIKEVDHESEDRINQPWNMVLFEIKMLRDYFVDKTVIPKQTPVDHRFLTMQHFILKFIPFAQSRYINVTDPEQKEQALKLPAITHFLRSKLIICEHKVNNRMIFGEELELDQSPTSKQFTSVFQQLQLRMGDNFDESISARLFSIVVDKLIPILDKPEVPITKELRDMMIGLVRVTLVPNDVQAVPLD